MILTYSPLPQTTGLVEKASQYDPAGHTAHKIEPSLLENVPASQGLHAVEFVTDEYPAKHIVAPVVEGQLYPAGQSVHFEAAAYEDDPGRHGLLIPFLHSKPASQTVQESAPSSE